MRAGIPQGGKISPVLYSLNVNDIPKTHKTLLGMYADDTAILATNKSHNYTAAALNQHLAKLDDWFLKWKIALNVNKTEAVPILPKNFKILKSCSKRHVTSLSEQLTKNYHFQTYEFSQQQQLLFTGTCSYSALATIPQDPDERPPTQPLPATTAADHLILRTEIIPYHQLTITGDWTPFADHGPQKLLASFMAPPSLLHSRLCSRHDYHDIFATLKKPSAPCSKSQPTGALRCFAASCTPQFSSRLVIY
ncbi:hypothetical protein AVEN_245359-1 [Araneus ventricosus]|uniref:Reverse transcriptase domain-containing protein n=1 Tax=Araneus ventricosus TaxID=182803 RepID=A0A4Y2QNS9_ARAVE|nr:hypothetical protein AVEN_245359-1 [Araneus ventricosus]